MGVMRKIISTALALAFTLAAANPGDQAYLDGNYPEAEKHFLHALQNAPDESGINTFNLAAVFRAQGRYAEADPLYRKVIQIRETALGPRDASLATPLDGLALTCQSEGNLAEAEQLAARAVAIEQTPRTINIFAIILTGRGKYGDAESVARRAVSMAAPSSVERAEILATLAMLSKRRGNNARAETLYRESAAMLERTAGPHSPETGAAWNNLAQVLTARGNFAEADSFYARAAAVLERAWGGDDARVIAIERNRAKARATLTVNAAPQSQVPHCRPEICGDRISSGLVTLR
jgi:tetratricopeptide (TPR) repeat protein